MKYFILPLLLLIVTGTANAQTKALTDDGKQVTLYDDGTWKYVNDSTGVQDSTTGDPDSIRTNPQIFSKSKKANFLVKSKTVDIGIYIDPTAWVFRPAETNEVLPEYHFSLKSKDGYAMLISEKTDIGLEEMKKVALLNAQKAAIDARIVKSEYRMVNNNKVLCLEMKATIDGVKFVYFGYYFSDSSGTIQLMTYTSQTLFDQSKQDMESFLNGLVLLNK